MKNTSLALPVPRRSLVIAGGLVFWLGSGLSAIFLFLFSVPIFYRYGSWITGVLLILLYLLVLSSAIICGVFVLFMPRKSRAFWNSAVAVTAAHLVFAAGSVLLHFLRMYSYFGNAFFDYFLGNGISMIKNYYNFVDPLIQSALLAVVSAMFLFAVVIKKRALFVTVVITGIFAGLVRSVSSIGSFYLYSLPRPILDGLDWILFVSFYLALLLLSVSVLFTKKPAAAVYSPTFAYNDSSAGAYSSGGETQRWVEPAQDVAVSPDYARYEPPGSVGDIRPYADTDGTVILSAPYTGVSSSAADEIMKYKQLLDMGAISEDEYAAKKKHLLNLDD